MLLVPYQSDWPHLFNTEAGRLREAIGDRIGAIEHIGSTAIPGTPAKPVIDMMGAVKSLAQAEQMVGDVEGLGYEWGPRDRQDVPDRFYFVRRTPDQLKSTHHLSLAETTSGFWRRQVAFRDYLRATAEAAREYLDLKQRLAQEHPNDPGAYVDSKTDFVEKILRLASGSAS
ncbi:MAG: GrpB family protein [Phycisphaerae bacterium]|nr:GrpB family protein [Phycisphaerae bacterium]